MDVNGWLHPCGEHVVAVLLTASPDMRSPLWLLRTQLISLEAPDQRRLLQAEWRPCAGMLSWSDFVAGCAALGVTLTDGEEAYVRALVPTGPAPACEIKWREFVSLFEEA